MSRQRAEELTRIKTDLQTKFAAAVQAIDQKIQAEERENEDLYKTVGSEAAKLAKMTDSTAAGIMALRQFPREGGPRQ